MRVVTVFPVRAKPHFAHPFIGAYCSSVHMLTFAGSSIGTGVALAIWDADATPSERRFGRDAP